MISRRLLEAGYFAAWRELRRVQAEFAAVVCQLLLAESLSQAEEALVRAEALQQSLDGALASLGNRVRLARRRV